MAKKNFKSGLGELFGSAMEETPKVTPQKQTRKTRKKKTSTKPVKSFMSNLDALLQEAIEEGVQEQVEKIKKNKRTVSKRKKPMFGLDALIRETVETSKVQAAPQNTKRVTFIFDEDKINKLQKIARFKKAYVKDVVNEIISEYIDNQDIKKA